MTYAAVSAALCQEVKTRFALAVFVAGSRSRPMTGEAYTIHRAYEDALRAAYQRVTGRPAPDFDYSSDDQFVPALVVRTLEAKAPGKGPAIFAACAAQVAARRAALQSAVVAAEQALVEAARRTAPVETTDWRVVFSAADVLDVLDVRDAATELDVETRVTTADGKTQLWARLDLVGEAILLARPLPETARAARRQARLQAA